MAALFNEELGAVIQIKTADATEVAQRLHDAGLAKYSHRLGTITADDRITVRRGERGLLSVSRVELQQAWSETTREMQAMRDNPECAQEEFERIAEDDPAYRCSSVLIRVRI